MFRTLKVTDLACVSAGTTVVPISQTPLLDGGVSGRIFRVPTSHSGVWFLHFNQNHYPPIRAERWAVFKLLLLSANGRGRCPGQGRRVPTWASPVANGRRMLNARSQGLPCM